MRNQNLVASLLMTVAVLLIASSSAAQEWAGDQWIALEDIEPSRGTLTVIPGPAIFLEKDFRSTQIEASGTVVSENGDIENGDSLRADELILEGIFTNRSDHPIFISGGSGSVFRIDPGEDGYVVENFGGGCSVSCGSGYYACCNSNVIFEDSCECVTIGSSESCDSGGTGSTGCSVGDVEISGF